MSKGWLGVDLDGTLARYDVWRGEEYIGDPVPIMLRRVKRWLQEKKEVRIFTARIAPVGRDPEQVQAALWNIQHWCREHIGVVLPVTCQKDHNMTELWDDRAVQVEKNTGKVIGFSTRGNV